MEDRKLWTGGVMSPDQYEDLLGEFLNEEEAFLALDDEAGANGMRCHIDALASYYAEQTRKEWGLT